MAEPTEIFMYLADLKYHRLWNPTLVRVVPEVPLAEGVEYKSYNWLFNMKIMGKVKVVKVLPPNRLDIQSIAGMLEYDVSYRLAKRKNGTESILQGCG